MTTLRILAVASVVVAAGCYTDSVRRAALVPHAQPSLRDGQPVGDARAEVALGLATAVQAHEPGEGNGNAGVEIPRLQSNVAVRLRATNDVDVSFLYEHASPRGATAIADDQPEPQGTARGYGVGMNYSIPTSDPGFRVGLTGDFLVYRVPVVEYRTCIDCPSPITNVDHYFDEVPVVSFAVTPSLARGPFTYFGSFTLRNHPTIARSSIEGPLDWEEDLEAGRFNAIAAVGASYTMPARVRGSLLVYQNLSRDPVAYGPTLAVAVTIPLGTVR